MLIFIIKMKENKININYLSLFVFLLILICSYPYASSLQLVTNKETQRIRDLIYAYAKIIKFNSTDMHAKKMMHGDLPSYYPSSSKEKIKKFNSNPKNFLWLMSNPTKLYGFCQFPKYKINTMTYCEHIFPYTQKQQIENCQNSFCLVCCDHLTSIYSGLVNNNKHLSSKLNLTEEKLRKSISDKDIMQCRKECNDIYQGSFNEIQEVEIAAPRDPSLGKSNDNPAISCNDIKKWGDEHAKSGVYWIEYPSKGIVKAFCEMEIEGGGWTLFFNYKADNNDDIVLNMAGIPSDKSINSHINKLQDLDVYENEVKELMFYCEEKEKRKKNGNFIFFSTKNTGLIKTAIYGDQNYLKSTFNEDDFTDVLMHNVPRHNKRTISKENIEDIDYFGSNREGGLWDNPFGNIKEKMFWSVKNGITECGSFQKNNFDLLNDEYKKGIHTIKQNQKSSVHSIYYRGNPLSDEKAYQRYLNRNKN